MTADPMKDATELFLDRRIRIAERIAEHLVAMLRGMLTEFGLDPADPDVAAVVRKHLAVRGAAGTGHAGKAADLPEIAFRLKLAGSTFVDIADLLRVTSLTAASLVQEGANAMPRRRAHMTPAMRAEEDQRWSHAKLR